MTWFPLSLRYYLLYEYNTAMKVFDIIRQNKDQILKRWLTAVKQHLL